MADIWTENVMEDLKSGNLSYAIVREFLADLKEEFRGEDDKTIKVVELKKVEQVRQWKIVRKGRNRNPSTKTKYKSIMATDATASGLAKKTRGFLTASVSRACFHERSRKDECDCSKSAIVDKVFILVRPIYYEYESRNELLQL